MKVLHLSTFDIRGGAARGAYWLHRALAHRGVDSQMLVGRKYGDDPTVFEPQQPFHRFASAVRGRLDPLPLNRYRKTSESYWTVGWLPDGVARAVSDHTPDLVHVHWTGGGFMSVDSLRDLGCPVIWTLRDMWAFTGGCHYSAGCERFAQGCGRCPQLRSESDGDLSRRVWERKRNHWRGLDLWLVPISNWLADNMRRSSLFEDMPVEVIPNGIDTATFRPFDRTAAKRSWGLSEDRRHILFGAIGPAEDARKGLHHLVNAVRILVAEGWSDSTELVVFGGEPPADLASLGLPVRSVGVVNDDDALAELYGAADVMVAPSEQEAFGKTLIEAMACGTPVVAFDSGGPVDIVDHQRNGYLARSFDVEALATGIAWCIADEDRSRELGQSARERATEAFEIDLVAARYQTLYRHILSRAP